jgi:hypothetical protein
VVRENRGQSKNCLYVGEAVMGLIQPAVEIQRHLGGILWQASTEEKPLAQDLSLRVRNEEIIEVAEPLTIPDLTLSG